MWQGRERERRSAQQEHRGTPFSSNLFHSIWKLRRTASSLSLSLTCVQLARLRRTASSLSHTIYRSLTWRAWQDAFLLVWNLPDKNLDDNATTPQTPQTPQIPERHEYADAALRSLVRTCLETQASLSSPLPALTSLTSLSAVLDARKEK